MLASKPFEPHDVAALLETTRGQGRSDHLECEASLFCTEIRQHHTVPEQVRVNVEPGPPLFGVDRKLSALRVDRVERAEKCRRRLANRASTCAAGGRGEQPRDHGAVTRDTSNRYGQRLLHVGHQAFDDRSHVGR
jgi:hypothetical protein